MFGKFPPKYVVSIICLLVVHPIYSNTNRQDLSINGYQVNSVNGNLNKAIRLQGIGDFFFKKKAYAQSIPYYEQALQLIPQEADITFRLAEVYQNEKLWRLSILYYNTTIDLLKEEVNYGKSQLNSYIAEIRIAYICHLQNNKDETLKRLEKIREQKSLLISLYPEAWEELKNFDSIYPETAIRKPNN
ncbi:MAG: tetratricopeptide repeat protein [Brevinema sp.]